METREMNITCPQCYTNITLDTLAGQAIRCERGWCPKCEADVSDMLCDTAFMAELDAELAKRVYERIVAAKEREPYETNCLACNKIVTVGELLRLGDKDKCYHCGAPLDGPRTTLPFRFFGTVGLAFGEPL